MKKQIILPLALLLSCHNLTAEEAPKAAAAEQAVIVKAEAEKATVAILRKKVIEAEAATPLLPEDAKEKKIDEASLTEEQKQAKRSIDFGTVKEIHKPRGNN